MWKQTNNVTADPFRVQELTDTERDADESNRILEEWLASDLSTPCPLFDEKDLQMLKDRTKEFEFWWSQQTCATLLDGYAQTEIKLVNKSLSFLANIVVFLPLLAVGLGR